MRNGFYIGNKHSGLVRAVLMQITRRGKTPTGHSGRRPLLRCRWIKQASGRRSRDRPVSSPSVNAFIKHASLPRRRLCSVFCAPRRIKRLFFSLLASHETVFFPITYVRYAYVILPYVSRTLTSSYDENMCISYLQLQPKFTKVSTECVLILILTSANK